MSLPCGTTQASLLDRMQTPVPTKYQRGKAAEHLNAMRLFFIIRKFFEGEKFNKTLADEAEAWAKKHGVLQEG